MKKRIQVIDDESFICKTLKEGLIDLDYEVRIALNGNEGLKKISEFKPHVVFVDMRLQDENGLDLIQKIKKIDQDIEIVIMTAYGDIQTAVTAMKNDAFDYINKPLDLEEIDLIIKKAVKNLKMKNRINLYEKEKKLNHEDIIGEHALMKEVYKKIDILSKNDSVTVLIRGETGTGKELVAKAIHNQSVRSKAPIMSINCSTLPQDLVESELVGFEKNAFTGANSTKKGLLEIADGGTVFLDEIGEIALETQSKLLRFLEERKFKRIGGISDIEVDIRVIAATNRNLEKAIDEKKFRSDLYYRLNVVPIKLPPLRKRGKDILLLAEYYLDKYNHTFSKQIKDFTNEVKDKLLNYRWPGNVRELKNVIERIVILHNSEKIELDHLPPEINKHNNKTSQRLDKQTNKSTIKTIDGEFSLEKELESIEKEYIKIALDKCNNNYTKASELLDISRFALKRRIEKYFKYDSE